MLQSDLFPMFGKSQYVSVEPRLLAIIFFHFVCQQNVHEAAIPKPVELHMVRKRAKNSTHSLHVSLKMRNAFSIQSKNKKV